MPPRKHTQRTQQKRTHQRTTRKSPRKTSTPGATRTIRRTQQRSRRPARRTNNDGSRRRNSGVRTQTSEQANGGVVPPIESETVRVIPLGGVEEIGRNMTAIEYGDDIVIVDCGFQFREENTPGIDYILPNTQYLEENKKKIRGIFITHGHLDHIGGIPYLIEALGYPPIYSRRLTTTMIKKRQEEFPHMKPLNIIDVETEETIPAGNLRVSFFAVTHTIPDSMGIIVQTPYGNIVHTGDLKLDHEDGVPLPHEEEEFARFKDMDVLLLMADSTNVERPGFSIPERLVFETLDEIIRTTNGRLIIGTFASQLERVVKLIESAEKHGKKVVIEGRSMKTNVEIIKQLGMLKTSKHTFIPVEQMEDYPPEKIVVLATGAQGDEFAALMRTANKTHRHLSIRKGDTIVLSSSIIPGNERAVQKLKDNLSRQGAVIIHYQVSDVHSSGHANRDETAWIHNKVKPRFFIPMHGYHYMLRVHAEIAKQCGVPEDNIAIPDNGTVIEIVKGEKMVVRKEKPASGIRMVDGFSVGDIQDVVIRDRQMMAQDGMFVIIATINLKTGKLKKSPDIISRGFVYLRESQDLLQETRLLIAKTTEDLAKNQHPINFDYIKDNLTDTVGAFLFQKTNKHPIVIPVILGV